MNGRYLMMGRSQGASNQAEAPSVLPEGWIQHKSTTSGRTYYFNKSTGMSVWSVGDIRADPPCKRMCRKDKLTSPPSVLIPSTRPRPVRQAKPFTSDQTGGRKKSANSPSKKLSPTSSCNGTSLLSLKQPGVSGRTSLPILPSASSGSPLKQAHSTSRISKPLQDVKNSSNSRLEDTGRRRHSDKAGARGDPSWAYRPPLASDKRRLRLRSEGGKAEGLPAGERRLHSFKIPRKDTSQGGEEFMDCDDMMTPLDDRNRVEIASNFRLDDASMVVVVVDTNVLLNNLALCKDIVKQGGRRLQLAVPWMVIDELDHLKVTREKRIRLLARDATRWLDEVTKGQSSNIVLQKASEVGGPALPTNSVADVADNRILDYCLFWRRKQQLDSVNSCSLLLLTNDRNLALKARAEEVKCVDSAEMSPMLANMIVNSSTASSCLPPAAKLAGETGVAAVPRAASSSSAVMASGGSSSTLLGGGLPLPGKKIESWQADQVEKICLTFLEQLLIGELEASYGATWQQIIKVKPRKARPFWSQRGLFAAFAKHHIAVFSINYNPNDRLLVKILKDLQTQLGNAREHLSDLVETLLTLCQMVQEGKTTASQNAARQCQKALRSLLLQESSSRFSEHQSAKTTVPRVAKVAEAEKARKAQSDAMMSSLVVPGFQGVKWTDAAVPVGLRQSAGDVPVLDGVQRTEDVLVVLTHVWHIICTVAQGMCLALHVELRSAPTEPRYILSLEEAMEYCQPFTAAVTQLSESYSCVITSQGTVSEDHLLQLHLILSSFKSTLGVRECESWSNTPAINLNQLRTFILNNRQIMLNGEKQLDVFRCQLMECLAAVDTLRRSSS